MTSRRRVRTPIVAFRRARRTALLVLAGVAGGAGACLPAPAAAQSVDWIASLLVPAQGPPFVSEWDRNPHTLLFTVTYVGTGEQEVLVEGVLREVGGPLLARAISFPIFFSGGPVTRTFNGNDLQEWRLQSGDRGQIDQIVRAGVIPEAEYELCARVVTNDRFLLAEACAETSIRFPDRPELLYPQDQDAVGGAMPTFQWTPVLVPPSVGLTYRLRVAERYQGQTARQALDLNPPHLEREVGAAPLFSYPLDELPLEEGREYAWDVEALDGAGNPLLAGGLRSEAWGFTRTGEGGVSGGGREDDDLLDELTDIVDLVQGLARITGLSELSARSDPMGLRYTGLAWLEILAPEPLRTRIRLDDLVVAGSGPLASVVSGAAEATIAAGGLPLLEGALPVEIDLITWDPIGGLQAGARVRLPSGGWASLRGDARYTAGGIVGTLRAAGAGGTPLMRAEGDPVAVEINEITLQLPSLQLELDGGVGLFGEAAGCAADGAVGSGGLWNSTVVCTAEMEASLSPGSAGLRLRMHSVGGAVALDLASGAITPDLHLLGLVTLAPPSSMMNGEGGQGSFCEVLVEAALDNAGFRTTRLDPRCGVVNRRAVLDWLEAEIEPFTLTSLTYAPGQGFGFQGSLSLHPRLPALPDLSLPPFDGVELGSDGLRIPALTLDDLTGVLEAWGLRLRLDGLTVPSVTIPWSDWAAGDPGSFGFAVQATATLPGGTGLPSSCLGEGAVELAVADGTLTITGPDGGEDPTCRIELGGGAALLVDGFDGETRIDLRPPFTVQETPVFQARFLLPDAMRCADDEDPILLPDGVPLPIDGHWERIEIPIPLSCGVPLPYFVLEMSDAFLIIEGPVGDPDLLIAGGARVRLGPGDEPVSASGTIGVDPRVPRIVGGSLQLDEPFLLAIPRDEPVFIFEVTTALLDPAGLHVDGRQSLLFGDVRAGVTFQETRFGLEQPGLEAGMILFDAPFVLQAAVGADGIRVTLEDPDASPESEALGAGDEARIRVGLPPTIALTPDGFVVEGDGSGELILMDLELPEVAASFRELFALDFGPTEVVSGAMDLVVGGIAVATLDATGFHIHGEAVVEGILPARLGLPTEALAYLELRDEADELRVTTAYEGETGLRIQGTVPLVLPILASAGAGAEPSADVTVNLLLDRVSGEVTSGEVILEVTPALAVAMDLPGRGVPLDPRRIRYGEGATGVYALFLDAGIALPGEDDPIGEVSLEITQAGRLVGSTNVTAAGNLSFVPPGDRFTFGWNGMEVDFDLSLTGGPGSWSVSLPGNIALALGDGAPANVGATLVASELGFGFQGLDLTGHQQLIWFVVDQVEIGIANLAVPLLERLPGGGWDFDVAVDMAFRFPTLDGLELPSFTDIRIRPGGITLPALHLPELNLPMLEMAGVGLRPLAFRMAPLEANPFGAGGWPDDFGFRFDLELSLSGLPGSAPQPLRDLRLSVLDAGFGPDGLSGIIEPTDLGSPIPVTLGAGGMGLLLDRFAGALNTGAGPDGVELSAGGAWRLPDAMLCADQEGDALPLGDATVRLHPDGSFSGTVEGLLPSCPYPLGPVTLAITRSDLTLEAGPGAFETVGILDTDVRLDLPGPGGMQAAPVSFTGSLGLNLVEPGILHGSVALNQPFSWGFPEGDPVLSFTVDEGVLDERGLVLSGGGNLPVADGVGVAMGFDGLTIGLPEGAVTGGSAVFLASFGLEAGLVDGGLDWRVVGDPAALPEVETGLRLSVPAQATLTAQGLALSGSGSAAVVLAGQDFAGLGVDFMDGFAFDVAPFRVDAGRASFLLDGSEVAWLDRDGLWPGDIFGVLPLPERLAIPSENVAYIQLRNAAGDLVVEGIAEGEGYRIRSRAGETAELVLPAFSGLPGGAPTLGISFDVVVNPANWGVVSGVVSVEAGESGVLFPLDGLGLPIDVTGLRYGPGSGYSLTVDARLRLPASLSGMEVDLVGMSVGADGLAGEIRLGSYRDGATSSDPPLTSIEMGPIGVGITGVLASFGGASQILISGDVTTTFFGSSGGAPTPLRFEGAVSADGSVELSAGSLDHLPNGRLPLGLATFEPVPIGGDPALTFFASAQEFGVRLGGVLRVPSLSDDFAVSLPGLEIASTGVTLPSVNLTGSGNWQSFGLFGMEFTIRDGTGGGPGLALSIDAGVLLLTMNGELDWLDQTATFRGLQVGTDGTVRVEEASLLSEPVAIVEEVLTLNALGIEDAMLHADFGVTLPGILENFENQEVTISVAPDGSVDGGGVIELLPPEQPGLGGGRTQVDMGVVTLHLRYLGLRLNASDVASGGVEAVADIYFDADAQKRVKVGRLQGNSVEPGLRVGFNGSVEWGNVRLAQEFGFDQHVLRITMTEVSVPDLGGGDLSLAFSGSLAVSLPMVTGGLGFTELQLSPTDGIDLGTASIQGGTLSVAGVFSVALEDFVYHDSPTTVTIEAGGEAPSSQRETIQVDSYVGFGGHLTVGVGSSGSMMGGGVEEFLFYRSGDETVMIVRNAELAVPRIFSMVADIRYERRGNDFDLLVGAEAMIAERWGGRIIGLIAKEGSDFRAGLFVSVSASIPIVPGVLTLAEVGGGFFYNPTQAQINAVRSMVGVDTNPTVEGGRFVGLLYAQATIVSESIAFARVLITISDAGLEMNGQMALLGGSNPDPATAPISASVNLAVGFQQVFVEGNATLEVDFSFILRGSGTLSLFIYSNAWGIMGGAEARLLGGLVNGAAEFMVGSEGFLMSADIDAGFDFWIISVNASMHASVWLLGANNWGAYVAVEVRASLLGGVIRGRAKLQGALVSGPIVYAGALAEGCILVKCASANISARFGSGGVRGRFGRNWEMEEAIDRARGTRNSLQSSMAALAAAAAAEPPVPAAITISNEDLLAAYHRIREWDPAVLETHLSGALLHESETAQYSPAWATEASYFQRYTQILTESTAPKLDQALMNNLYNRVESTVGDIAENQGAVSEAMSDVRMEIGELRQVAEGAWPETPLHSISFQAPVTSTGTDADGNETKEMVSGPGFDVDQGAEAAMVAELESRQEENDALLDDIRERIQEVEDGVEELRTVLRNTAPGSMLHFAELHARLLSATEERFARQGAQVLEYGDWLVESHTYLNNARNHIQNLMIDRRQASPAGRTTPGCWNPSPDGWAALAITRAVYLDNFTGNANTPQSVNSQIQQQYCNLAPSHSAWGNQADLTGLSLWNDIGRLGTLDAYSRIWDEFNQIRQQANTRLTGLWVHLTILSVQMEAVYRDYRELVGVLHDLYDGYLEMIDDMEGMEGEAAEVSSRRSELLASLTPPRVNNLAVFVNNQGYYSWETFVWTGSHPDGVYENFFQVLPGRVDFPYAAVTGGLPVGMMSSGGNIAYVRYGLTPSPGAETEERTLLAGVRGGAGYLGLARAEYTSLFRGGDGVPAGSGTMVGTTPDQTPPSRPNPRFRRHDRWSNADDGIYWIPDTDRIEFRWHAQDQQSGIAEYEYAVGTVANNTSVRDWTSSGARSEITVHGLDIPANPNVRVFVRARNGAELWSPVGRSAPFRHDPTPPVWPEDAHQELAAQAAVVTEALRRPQGSEAQLYQASDQPPQPEPDLPYALPGIYVESLPLPGPSGPYGVCSHPGPVNFLAAAGTPGIPGGISQYQPSVSSLPYSVGIPRPLATDPQSGVREYAWHVGVGQPGPGYDPEAWTGHPANAGEIGIPREMLAYGDSLYLQVVAINNGFGVSEPLVASFHIPDPTPPGGLAFCLGQGASGLRLGISSAPRDLESGISRITYRIRTADGTVLRDTVPGFDLDPAQVEAGRFVNLQSVPIPHGAAVHVEMLVENGEGLRRVWDAGPFTPDFSKPGMVSNIQVEPTELGGRGMFGGDPSSPPEGESPSESPWETLLVSFQPPALGTSGISSVQWTIGVVEDLDAWGRPPSTVFMGSGSGGDPTGFLIRLMDNPWPPPSGPPLPGGVQISGGGGDEGHPTDRLLPGVTYEIRIRTVNGRGMPGDPAAFQFVVPADTEEGEVDPRDPDPREPDPREEGRP